MHEMLGEFGNIFTTFQFGRGGQNPVLGKFCVELVSTSKVWTPLRQFKDWDMCIITYLPNDHVPLTTCLELSIFDLPTNRNVSQTLDLVINSL